MEPLYLDLLPPRPGTIEYKLENVFFKGSSKPKPTPNTSQEIAAAEVALSRYSRYMSVYRPLENAAIADVMSDEAGERVERTAGGRLNADAAQTMAAAQPGYGEDPSGGNVQRRFFDTQRAAIIANAAGEQAGLGRKQKLAGLSAAINIGTGQAKEAQIGFDKLAGESLDRAIRSQELAYGSDAQDRNTWGSAIGAGAAFGTEIYRNRNA